MNISATLDGKSVTIVDMIPSQVVGYYYILYIDLSNELHITEKTREEFASSLATNASINEEVSYPEYENEVKIFPLTTYCAVVSSNYNFPFGGDITPANTWRDWEEVCPLCVGGAGGEDVYFSEKFKNQSGRILTIIWEYFSYSDAYLNLINEISYGDDKTILGRSRIWVPAAASTYSPQLKIDINSPVIPAGEKVYWRIMTNSDDEVYVYAHFRYYNIGS